MAEDQYDVVAFSQGHECYETFEVYLDEVTDKIRKLLGDYSVPGGQSPRDAGTANKGNCRNMGRPTAWGRHVKRPGISKRFWTPWW